MSIALQPSVVAWPQRMLLALPHALAAEGRRLAPWLAVAMIAGVLAYFAGRTEPPRWTGWAALAPLPLALWLARRGRPLLAWGAGMLAAVGLGYALALWAAARAPPPLDLPRGAVVVTGTVAEVDPLPGEVVRLTLRGATWAPGMAPAARDVRVRLRARDTARPAPGDTVRVRALLRPPSAPAHPGAWDFQRDAYFSGLGGSGFALGPVEVVAVGGAAPPLSGVRAAVEARVMAAVPGAAGAVAAALLTGGQSAIPPAEMAAMRDSGLAHLLSVSGVHVAIVMGVAFWVARALLAASPGFALRWGTKAQAAVVALAAGAFYMVLTGSQVPMQRSFAMAALVTAGLIAGRRAISPRVLAFAAVVVVAVQPAAVLGPSFQMSFAAVLALIAAYEGLRPRLTGAPLALRLLLPLGLTVMTSVVAGLATLPFGLHHFGRLQLYGVAANAVAVPLTSFVVMPAGMLALALMPFGLEGWALTAMGWGTGGVLWVAAEVAAWPGAATAARPMPLWGLGLVALGLCWLCLWRRAWRWLGVPLALAGLLSADRARLPDAMVSADGRLLALQAGGALFVERRPGAQRFVQEVWLRGAGLEAGGGTPLPREGEAAGGRILCEPALCVLRDESGAPLVALLRPAPQPPTARGQRAAGSVASEPGCGRAPVLLSPEPVRGRCPGSAVVDRFSVWRDGAHAVWVEAGAAQVLSDRAHRGDRPWVPPRPLPRATSEEPPAATE